MTPKHSAYGPRDDQPLLDGDVAFSGLNMALEPDLLKPGEYSFARNIRLRRGKPSTRRGCQFMSWSVQTVPNAETVWASLSFRSPTGIAYILKARTTQAEACDPTGGTQVIAYPGGVTLTSECELVQLFDRVILFRGTALAPLVWAPPSNWASPFATAFAAISLSVGGSGTQPIPNADWGYLFKNRAIVPFSRDQLAASDVLDYTRYDPVAQQFKINAGDEQSIQGVIKGGRDTLLVFKDYSVFSLENFTGTLGAVTQDILPIDVGLGARRTLCAYGTEIFFLGPDVALYNLSQALDNRLQGEEVAFSDPIEPLMESIEPTLLSKCVAKIWNKYLWLAVPIGDGATAANVILIYDFTRGAWVGADTSGLFNLQNLVIFPYQGRQRLFFVHTDGGIYLLDEGYEDVGPGGAIQIPSEFISRGYTCGVEGLKAFTRGEAVLSTWDPVYTVESGANGGNL
jgi:hypothetical protein